MTESLTRAQLSYLTGERRLARLATADRRGRPHVTPVGMWSYNETTGTIDVTGHDLAATKKFRNVLANPHAALVVDDVASVDPWHPRAVMIQGTAETVEHEAGSLIRITPETIVAWGIDD